MSDSFTIYRNTLDALETLPPETSIKIVSYVGRYAMDDIEPDNTDPVAYAFFRQIRPLLDKSKKRAEAGRQGGEANVKQNEANGKQNEANVKQTASKTKQTTPINKKVESRNIKKENIYTLSSGAAEYQYKAVIDYLNEKAGTAFKDKSKDSRSHIKARFDDGFTLDDFKTVIDKKVAEWGGTDMAKFLRPSTLFGTKFESYLNQQTGKKSTKNRFNNFEGRGYNYDELERQLLAAQWGNT